MAASLRGLVLASVCLLASCSGVQSISDGPGQVALLRVDCEPPDAEILIDEQPMGSLSRWRGSTVPLRPGKHRVEITREGYLPYMMDLNAEPGRMYDLALDLLRDMDTELIDPRPDPKGAPGAPFSLPSRAVPPGRPL